MTATKIRVLLADDEILFRQTIRNALELEPDLEIVAEASSGLGALAEAEKQKPALALLDSDLPNCDGIRATCLILDRVENCRVLVLGEEDAKTLAAAVQAGASGYFPKTSPLSELIAAIHTIHEGQMMIPQRMLGPFVARLIRRRNDENIALRLLFRLSHREREVLRLLADGADNDGIAQALIISPQTARTHVQRVLSKLGVHSRLEAAAFFIHNAALDQLVDSRR